MPHIKQGLFGRRPTPHVIDRLVDFHVAHSAAEAAAGRGFDIDLLQAETARRNGNFAGSFPIRTWERSRNRGSPTSGGKHADNWPTSSHATARIYVLSGVARRKSPLIGIT